MTMMFCPIPDNHREAVDLDGLSPVMRLLLVNDGTLTELLEAASSDTIAIVGLDQHMQRAAQRVELLDLDVGEALIDRKIVLRGERSRTHHVYAESLIAIDRLPSPVRHALLTSNTPIGRLCRQHRLEIFKEIIEFGRQPAGELCRHLPVERNAAVLARTCRLSMRGRPVMLIKEYFSPALEGLAAEADEAAALMPVPRPPLPPRRLLQEALAMA